MVILQQPDILSLSGNIKEFRISSTDPVSFTLSQGGVEVLAQSYTPGKDGIITINLRDIVHSRLSFNLQESAIVYEQTTLASDFVADISGTRVTFRAIRSGVDRLADTATNFLTQNFLTWQPSLKAVTYYSPEFLTYYAVVPCVAKLRAYYTDISRSEPSQQDITLADLTAGKAYTIPLQYAAVAAKLGNKLPAYYDVFVESASGARLTYIQRYYASDMLSEQEQWVLFENSLGGIDTFRAYGSTEFSADHTHNIAEIDEVSSEYRVDTERKFQKNTGHLTTKERTWLLDFFPSHTKYIYAGTYLRPIVVLNSNVTYTDRELPSNYTFTYKYADSRPLLNLPRTDVPSEVLDITVPSVGSFTVPPRLVEFPRLPLTEGALFPIQQPYSEEWSTTTGGALYDFIAKRLSQNGNNGGVGHEHNNFELLQILKYADGYLNVGDNKIKVGYADKAGSIEGVDLDLWKKKQDPNGNSYLYTDLPIVTRSGLITYNDDGSINLPDLYAGLPLDGTTIGRDSSGALTVLGGVGSDFDKAQMWASLSGSGAEQINKSHLTDALAGYARTSDIPSLSGYATESWVNDKGYVTTTRLNELIGGASSAFDTLKEIEDYINSHESVTAGLIASLGNKVDKVTGMGLSEHSFTTSLRDKLNSIADGANKYILPVAKAAVLGGVMIGSNINVNAQGVISVEAPYSHPTQQVITAGAARHFLTGLAVNQYGHVTSATSAALTKDDLLSVLKDKDGVIRLDAQLALTGSLINFANLGTVNIPSLYDGIPVDGKSIYWENGTLKSSSTAGGGLAKVIVKVGLAAYESVDGVVTLPAYPTMPDLSNYATLSTAQTISGQKTFTSPIYLNNSVISDSAGSINFYTKEFGGQGLNIRSLLISGTYADRQYVPDQGLWAAGTLKANSFIKHGGTSSQFLKADGSVDSNAYVTIFHDHSYVRTGDYRDGNPVRFSNQTFTPFFLSGSKIALSGYFDAMYLNTYSDASGGRTNLIALSKVSGEMYRMMVDQGSAAWNGTLVKMLDSSNYSNYAMSLDTEQTVTGRKIYSTNQYYNNNIGIVTIDGQGLIFSDGTRTITGDATRPHRIRSNDSNLEHWRTGVGRYDILDGYNWASIIDGRYLPLSGGIMTGFIRMPNGIAIQSSEGFGMLFYDGAIVQVGVANRTTNIRGNLTVGGSIESNLNITQPYSLRFANGQAIRDDAGAGLLVSGGNKINFITNGDNVFINNSKVWHQGNDGTGSGLDADLLDGLHKDSFLQNIAVNLVSGTTPDSMPTDLITGLNRVHIPLVEYNATLQLTDFIGGWGQLRFTPNAGYSNRIRYRCMNNTTWKVIAYLDDNVASATKLQAARSIYGQPFDGTNNVSGKAFVDQRMGGVATVSLAIGDTDTGFDWASDGVYKIKSDGIDIAQVSQDRFHLYKKLVIESNEGNYCEGIRIKASSSNWVTIALGADGEFGTSENMWSIHRTADNNFAIARNDSSGTNGMFIAKNGYVGFGTVTPTCKMEIHGAIKAVNGVITTNTEVYAGDAIYAGGRIFTGYDAGVVGSISCSNWFRSNGATGWFNGTYNGGIYMADSDQVRIYNNKVLYNDGFRVWGIDGHHVGLKLYNQHHIGINLANAAYTWGIYAHNNGNMYIGRRNGDVNDISGSYYLIIGAGTMTYNGSIVLNGGGLITYSSDIRLKEIQEYFNPSLSELAALPIFAHSWRNGTPGVQLSTSAQAVQKLMPWNVFKGDDGYLKMDGTRTALAVSIRLAQLANEYITENERWKSAKDRQIEALQREVKELKQQLNVA